AALIGPAIGARKARVGGGAIEVVGAEAAALCGTDADAVAREERAAVEGVLRAHLRRARLQLGVARRVAAVTGLDAAVVALLAAAHDVVSAARERAVGVAAVAVDGVAVVALLTKVALAVAAASLRSGDVDDRR